MALHHSALLLGLHGRAERFPINETQGSAIGSKQREGAHSLHEAKSPCTPSYCWLCLSRIPSVDGEILCFPSPAEVPSWHSEPQKQSAEAGDWPSSPPRAGLPKLTPECGPSELAPGRVRGAQSSGRKEGVLATARGCRGETRFKPSFSRFKPQTHLWYQAQNLSGPGSSRHCHPPQACSSFVSGPRACLIQTRHLVPAEHTL